MYQLSANAANNSENLKVKIAFLTATLISFFSFSPLNAQSDLVPGQSLTLEEAIQIALENNYDIAPAESQVQAARAGKIAAFGQYLPNISANAGYSKILSNSSIDRTENGQIISGASSYSLSAQASYLLFNGFQREAEFERSDNAYESSYFQLLQTRADIEIEVTRRYLQMARLAQVVAIRRENVELGKRNVERFQAQYDAGVSPISDLLTQKADLGQRQLDEIRAVNDLRIAESALLAIMGVDPTEQIDLSNLDFKLEDVYQEIDAFRATYLSVDNALKIALENRPDLKALAFNIEAAENVREGANAGYMPSVFASGGWFYASPELGYFDLLSRTQIGLNISVPVFDQFQTNLQQQQAEVQIEQATANLRWQEQAIKQNIQIAELNLQAAIQQIKISETTVESAKLNYESAKERFDAGASSILDYFNANNQLIQSRISQIQAVYDYYLAEKEMEYQLGMLQNTEFNK